MRSPCLPLILFVVACSGNSLKVGSDDADSGKGGSSSGTSPGGSSNTGGKAARGGAGGDLVDNGGTGTGARGGATPTTGGSGGASAGGAATGGSATGGTMSITSCTEEFPFAGEWRGNILDFYFEPIEALQLSVRAENGGAGGYVGELTWGTGDPPPRATDANAPYPPGADFDGGAGRGGGPIEPWRGFPYTVVRGAGCDSSFRVSVSAAEIYDSWCSLQESIDSGEWGYACIVQGNGSSFDGTTCAIQDDGQTIAEYPQWRCDLCRRGSVCTCDASGCRYNAEPTHVFNLMLSADKNVLSGPDVNCGDCTVRLERVE